MAGQGQGGDDPSVEGGTYQFTSDWFSGHIPIWTQLLARLAPSRIVEVGCYEGRSACHLIETCGRERPTEIWCLDNWRVNAGFQPAGMDAVERRFEANVALASARAVHPVTVRKIKSDSALALAGLRAAGLGSSIDLVYLDASHEAADVLADAVLAFGLLRRGGLMIFDDYLWRPGADPDPLATPKPGVDAFLNIYARRMAVIPAATNVQVYAEKTAD